MDWRQLAANTRHWDHFGALPANDDAFAALGHFHDALATARPMNVAAMFALPGQRSSPRRMRPTRLVAVSRFRFAYSIISRVAESVASAILATGVVPIIEPIKESEMLELDPEFGFGRLLMQRGVYVWGEQE